MSNANKNRTAKNTSDIVTSTTDKYDKKTDYSGIISNSNVSVNEKKQGDFIINLTKGHKISKIPPMYDYRDRSSKKNTIKIIHINFLIS